MARHRRVRFPSGRIGKAYLLSQMDSASRYVPHGYLSAHEQDSDQEHGFRQAIGLVVGIAQVAERVGYGSASTWRGSLPRGMVAQHS